jgi:hypothetical protein
MVHSTSSGQAKNKDLGRKIYNGNKGVMNTSSTKCAGFRQNLRCFDEKIDEISHKARKVVKKTLQNFRFLRIFMSFYSKVAPFFRIFNDF